MVNNNTAQVLVGKLTEVILPSEAHLIFVSDGDTTENAAYFVKELNAMYGCNTYTIACFCSLDKFERVKELWKCVFSSAEIWCMLTLPKKVCVLVLRH